MAAPIVLTSNSPIQASSRLGSTAIVGTPEVDTRLLLDQVELGKTMAAQVVKVLDDGSALVKLALANQQASLLNMKLPAGYQLGDNLLLTLYSHGGDRPSFIVEPQRSQADQVQLSASAQLLEKTLLTHPQAEAVTGSHPITTQNNPVSSELASELNKTVENSGVFYESHLKQWQEGQRSLEQIRQEPQNQGPQDVNQWLPMQLDSLEHKHFAWQGEVWPDQNMKWDICEDRNQSQTPSPSAEDSTTAWQTSIRMHLPQLGLVTANIRLQGNQVGLQLHTANSGSARLLSTAGPLLLDALQSGGSQIDNFSVQNDAAS